MKIGDISIDNLEVFKKECPFIALSQNNNQLITKKDCLPKLNNEAYIFRVICENIIKYFNQQNNSLSCITLKFKVLENEEMASWWNDLEWTHYIFKHYFSNENIFFGKFSKLNYPKKEINNNELWFVIRSFNDLRDKKFINNRLQSQKKNKLLNIKFNESTSDKLMRLKNTNCYLKLFNQFKEIYK